MDKKIWLKIAAGWAFFMAACQTVISVWPAAAAYFQAPPTLLENRWLLFWAGEGATLVLIVFGLYALSGAGAIKRLPLLRLGLIGIGSLFVLRGLFLSLDVLIILGIMAGELRSALCPARFLSTNQRAGWKGAAVRVPNPSPLD